MVSQLRQVRQRSRCSCVSVSYTHLGVSSGFGVGSGFTSGKDPVPESTGGVSEEDPEPPPSQPANRVALKIACLLYTSFHDSTNFYGSTGNARGQAVVNISNAAFPILMARNDKNYWLAFGEKRAWDKNELAYITEAPSLVEPENVTRDTATFNLPFISLGQVGEGKLMVIGNPHYNSILRCPNGYSWEGGVRCV